MFAPVTVTDLVVQRVNGTREVVAPGAAVPLCNAIFPTAITVRVRLRPAARRLRLTATYPHGITRRHTVRPAHRRTRVTLFAADERLPGNGFGAGRYAFRVRAAGHRARATLTLTGAANC